MGRSFTAEILKLRKRPAPWVLLFIWMAIVAFSYFSTYAFAKAPIPEPPPAPTMEEAPPNSETDPGPALPGGETTAPAGAPAGEEEMPPEVEEQMQAEQEAFNEAFLQSLYPENLLPNLFSGGIFNVIGGALLLILGALTAGSEYGWGTLKTALTQRPGRIGTLLGKLLAFGAILLVFVVLGFATAALSSFIIARLEDAAVEWPAIEEILRGLGAATLILAVWSLFGFALAILLRGIAFAIGLGMVWLLAIESIVLPGFSFENETLENIRKALPGENATSLGSYFGSPLPEDLAFPVETLVDPGRAIWVLIAYAAGFILLSALLFWRRDAT